ncbi:autotransporter domain-containing protein [Sphingomonas sp. 1P06PA]|uniref:autotransporter domain-containing protein n=1 Tax=Sphingomonas sp. 1P06PA TaxID=554121 RepID=UPI0039A5A454
MPSEFRLALRLLTAGAALAATPALAQITPTTLPAAPATGVDITGPSFDRVVAFGDSYADIGNLFRLTGQPVPAVYPTGRFSGGTNFVDTLSTYYGTPQVNYAIGGSQAGSTNVVAPGVPGFQQQWQSFVGTGQSFGARDLLAVSIGGNDARAYRLSGGTLAGVDAAATVVAAQASAGINALVGRGARTVVFTAGDVGQLPEAIGQANASIGTAFSRAYNSRMQSTLSTIAASGVTVAYVDITTIGDVVRANPARFGFADVVNACPGAACVASPTLQSQYFFYVDGVHLTSSAFTLVGQYAINQLTAPYSFRAAADLPQKSAQAFQRVLDGRTDLARGRDGAAGLAAWLVFTGYRGDRDADASSDAYDYDATGAAGGVEFSGENSIFGVGVGYTRGKAQGFGATRIRADSYSIGGYAGFDQGGIFAQGHGGYSKHKLDLRRQGVMDPLVASPDADTVGLGGRAGFLFGSETTRFGPVVGAAYARTKVDGYTETGDPAASLIVSRQRLKALVGTAGAELRHRFSDGVMPWIRVSAAKDFEGDGRLIRYAPTTAPTIVNSFGIPRTSRDVYGEVAGGLSAAIGGGVSLDLDLKGSFARDEGDDASLFAGVRVAF